MKNILLVVLAFLLLPGCGGGRTKFQTRFLDSFDTVTVFTAYCADEREFDGYANIIRGEMRRLHELFDIYNNYEGINNLKTINDMAGISPVKCAPEIIDLISEGLQAFESSTGAVNIALGSVLRLWHDAREAAAENPDSAAAPDMDALALAANHTDIEKVRVNAASGTVYLEDPEMSLDVGALAKGWAVERAARLAREAGLKSGTISAGGNVLTIGAPGDGRELWSVGIQNPDGGDLYDVVKIADMAAVTSGDYERYFTVNEIRYHHIIDTASLMPASLYRAVTILHPDSGVADMLSTALFTLTHEEGLALSKKYSADALWIFEDGAYAATEGYLAASSNLEAD